MSGLSGIVGEVEWIERVLRQMAEAQEHRGGEKPVGWGLLVCRCPGGPDAQSPGDHRVGPGPEPAV